MRHLHGLYLSFGSTLDPGANLRVHALARTLLKAPLPGLTDIVPSYTALYLEYDARRLSRTRLEHWLRRQVPEEGAPGRNVTLPVRYDGADLPAVASSLGMSADGVVARHSGRDYRVYALGFTPGFPFLGEVDPAIRRPRRETPRKRVEAHSVAMAGAQTGIYPLPSPGGWNLLGHALEAVYEPAREAPFLLEPGDTVRFEPSWGEPPPPPLPLSLYPPEPALPLVRVVEPGLMDLLVDGGRPMVGRFGLARSGPLDALSAELANRLLGNSSDAPVLELNVKGPVLEALHPGVLSFAGWGMLPLLNGEPLPAFRSFAVRRGDLLRFSPRREGVRGYLAAAGGFEGGSFLGSSSVDARGLVGQPLHAGQLLGVRRRRAVRPGRAFQPYRGWGGTTTLRLVRGPQARPEALEALTRTVFTVSRADRMGIQLEGASVPGGEVLSEATPLGGVQVTPSGRPLLLLNDRGTLGGYEKPAVVHPADLPRVAQLRVGDRVGFVAVAGGFEVLAWTS